MGLRSIPRNRAAWTNWPHRTDNEHQPARYSTLNIASVEGRKKGPGGLGARGEEMSENRPQETSAYQILRSMK